MHLVLTLALRGEVRRSRHVLQSSSSALTSIRSSFPQGLELLDSASAAASSAQPTAMSCILVLVAALVAPNCIALEPFADPKDLCALTEPGEDVADTGGAGAGTSPERPLVVVFRVAGGADELRSTESPPTELMVLCRSAVASYHERSQNRSRRTISASTHRFAQRCDSPPCQCSGSACC